MSAPSKEAIRDAATRAKDTVVGLAKKYPKTSVALAMYATWKVLGKAGEMKQKRISANTVLELDLSSLRLVHASQPPIARAFNPTLRTVSEVASVIRMAAKDDRVRGLLVRTGGVRLHSFASVEELRQAVLFFRNAGNTDKPKKVALCYTDSFGESGNGIAAYFLATAFDRLFLSPSGMLTILPLSAQSPFVKGMMEKLSIEPEFMARKQYKNAVNMFQEDGYTEAHREATARLLESYNEQLAKGVAEGRSLEEKEAARLLSEGPFLAKEAVDNGLVDKLLYTDEVRAAVHKELGVEEKDVRFLFFWKYAKKHGQDATLYKGPKKNTIAYINMSGNIHLGSSQRDTHGLGGEVSIGSDTVCAALRAACAQEHVKAIILHVDSGGGSYTASDAIAHMVKRAREVHKKKVIAVMGNVAASGGYFVSMHADTILCQPSTLTGSIGVFIGKFFTADFYEKLLGIKYGVISSGDNALMLSGLQRMTEGHRARFNDLLDTIYGDFTSQVSQARSLTAEKTEEAARGRVWTGVDAKEMGLVDGFGGFHRAVEVAKELCEIKSDEGVKIVTFPKAKSAVSRVFSPTSDADNSDELDKRGGASATTSLGQALVGSGAHGSFATMLQTMSKVFVATLGAGGGVADAGAALAGVNMISALQGGGGGAAQARTSVASTLFFPSSGASFMRAGMLSAENVPAIQ